MAEHSWGGYGASKFAEEGVVMEWILGFIVFVAGVTAIGKLLSRGKFTSSREAFLCIAVLIVFLGLTSLLVTKYSNERDREKDFVYFCQAGSPSAIKKALKERANPNSENDKGLRRLCRLLSLTRTLEPFLFFWRQAQP